MKDFLRETEMDGTGHMCKIRAIGFAIYLDERSMQIDWTGDQELWQCWLDDNSPKYTSQEIYAQYLKYLEDASNEKRR